MAAAGILERRVAGVEGLWCKLTVRSDQVRPPLIQRPEEKVEIKDLERVVVLN